MDTHGKYDIKVIILADTLERPLLPGWKQEISLRTQRVFAK